MAIINTFISRFTAVVIAPSSLIALRKHFRLSTARMSSSLSHVSTNLAASPVAAYSQAVKFGDTVYLSGSLGIDVNTGKLVEGGVGPETTQTMKNIQAILEASQSSFSSVVKATVYLTDIKDGPTVNEIYKQFYVPPYPARVMFQVANLPLGAKVEIEVVAAVNK